MPDFYVIIALPEKCPNLHDKCPKTISARIFLEGHVPLAPVSYACMHVEYRPIKATPMSSVADTTLCTLWPVKHVEFVLTCDRSPASLSGVCRASLSSTLQCL